MLNQKRNSVSTCVDVPAGWSHRLRLSYQLLPGPATSCYQLPTSYQSWRGDVTGAQRRSPSPLQPASEITWDFWDHSEHGLCMLGAARQAIAGRSFLWNAALQSLHLGPGWDHRNRETMEHKHFYEVNHGKSSNLMTLNGQLMRFYIIYIAKHS